MVEDRDEILTHDIVEAAKERIYLVFHITVHLVERELLDVLSNVFVCDEDICTAFFQRDLFVATEVVARH